MAITTTCNYVIINSLFNIRKNSDIRITVSIWHKKIYVVNPTYYGVNFETECHSNLWILLYVCVTNYLLVI